MYYTQNLAEYHLRQIKTPEETDRIPAEYRRGLSANEFASALDSYSDMLHNLLRMVAENPAEFRLVCFSMPERISGAVSKDENKSLHSFNCLEILLQAMAHAPRDGDVLVLHKTDIKIPNLKTMLFGLEKVGFEIAETSDAFRVCYPDNYYLTFVFSAYGQAYVNVKADKIKQRAFVTSLLHNDTRFLIYDGNVTYTASDIGAICKREEDRAVLAEIERFFTSLGYIVNVEYGYHPARIRFRKKASSKETLIAVVERDALLQLHIRLVHLDKYTSALSEVSETVRSQTLQRGECAMCGYCSGGVTFVYESTEYRKCRIICSRCYDMLDIDDIPSIIKLINLELENT